MYFRTFTLSINIEKSIENAGFRANSYQEVKSFHGYEKENTILIPQDYYYDGSIWIKFDISDFFERLILLCRTPSLPFMELWQLYLNGDKEDRFGAVIIIAKQYANELITEIQSTSEAQKNNKVYSKKISELKTNPVITNCAKSKRILSAIHDLGF